MKETRTRRASRPPARRRGSLLGRLRSTPLWNEMLALALLVLAALLVISLVSYSPNDPAPIFGAAGGHTQAVNAAGPVGAFLAAAGFQILGVSAYLTPLLLLLVAWNRLGRKETPRGNSRLAGATLMVIAVAGLLSLWVGTVQWAGGIDAGGLLGSLTASSLAALLHSAGATVVLTALLALALLFTTRLSLQGAATGVGGLTATTWRRGALLWHRLVEHQRRRRLQRRAVRRHLQQPTSAPEVQKAPAVERQPAPESEAVPAAAEPTAPKDRDDARQAIVPPAPAPDKPPARRQEAEQLTLAQVPGNFTLPSTSLLREADVEVDTDEEELVATARLLTDKLQEFGVGGSVVAIHPGPVITTFEFKPDAGIKYSRITNLVDDLSLALKAESVRIDRMAGRSSVGVEVPNRKRETIRIREILDSATYRNARSHLPLTLGKTIDGRPYVASLERMPHLLIAGATGAGKSVGLNAMIASILFRATPDEVKFIFIDPKMLELGIYEDIPHLICPVVTDPSKAARALKWATMEMTRRYEVMFAHGVRNLEQYNRLFEHGEPPTPVRAKEDAPADAEPEAAQPLPYIIVVIDELADLMMVSSKEVEAAIQRLAQMARAVGIHLIVATQRPSVDVLTGVIKANFPSRIAYRVSSRTDSNVIMDQKGAERLLGMGDMLFLPPGASRLVRIHGALMEESEARRLASYLRQQGRPTFNDEVLKEDEGSLAADGGPVLQKDAMFDSAARLVVSMGQASVSHLQRRLGLGYARAARLMDSLEADGIVGPPDGSKPREVLVPADYFDTTEERAP